MANFEFKGYENQVLENEITSMLETKLAANQFLTVDESLIGKDGLTVLVHRYEGSGVAEDLERGEGNEADIDAEYSEEDYTATRTQARTRYYDDDLFTDSVWVDSKLKYLAEAMTNDFNAKAYAEMAKSNVTSEYSTLSFDTFADALGVYANEHENEEGLSFIIPQSMVPAVRKVLNENLVQTEGYIRTGAIGAILGCPIYPTKKLEGDTFYLEHKSAIKDFVKSPVRVEQTRDINTKENSVVADRFDVISLVDSTKCIKIVKA